MFSVKVSKIVEDLKLEKLFYLDHHGSIEVSSTDVNRPGLQLMDFFDYFDPTRIEVVGKVEMTYLDTMTPDARRKCLDKLFSKKFPMIVISRNMTPHPEFIEMAEKYEITWLPSDFKKKEGYKRSIELSKEYDLYRQNFCGCAYSKAESLKRP